MRVTVTISEPWELGEAMQWCSLPGELQRVVDDGPGGRVLIKLDDPIKYRGLEWHYVVGAPRHAGDRVASLQAGQKVLSALTGITGQQAMSDSPFDTSNWRGGLAFVGDIEPVRGP
jgi:hypothetical protein